MVKIKLKTNSPHLPKNQVTEVEEVKAKELVNSGMYIYNEKPKVKEIKKKIIKENANKSE